MKQVRLSIKLLNKWLSELQLENAQLGIAPPTAPQFMERAEKKYAAAQKEINS